MEYLAELEKELKYTFKNKHLLYKATCHRSMTTFDNIESNERLEFLGDSILEFVITEYLYKHTSTQEGDMTKQRAYIVCEESLYAVATKLNFAKYLQISKAQEKSTGKSKSILADMTEAVIAAIYLDGGIVRVKKFIIDNFKEIIDFALKAKYLDDSKSILQEKIQAHGQHKIEYILIKEEGPDHEKVFFIDLLLDGKKVASGIGKSKKIAQADAAKKALDKIDENKHDFKNEIAILKQDS